MALNRDDQDRIRGYLLGQLSDDEQQKIEERLMIEDDLLQELEISKDEVIENYCAGELTPKEQEWLEQHFLASSEGKFRKQFALSLDRIALAVSKSETVFDVPKGLSLAERFIAFWKIHHWATAAVASAAVLLLVGVVVWKVGLFPSQPKTSLALTLISSAPTRGGESPSIPKVSIPQNVDELTITLVLPEFSSPGASYRAELDDRSRTRRIEVDGYDDKSVRVLIPASQLSRGQYVLKLFATDGDGVGQPIPIRFFLDVQ